MPAFGREKRKVQFKLGPGQSDIIKPLVFIILLTIMLFPAICPGQVDDFMDARIRLGRIVIMVNMVIVGKRLSQSAGNEYYRKLETLADMSA